MSLSKASSTYNRQTWEDNEFPILCETCLGDNPYMRMLKDKYGTECQICTRPFTSFKWCPGAKMRYKKTEICQTCARLKNVCQTCILDLEYGLPVQVRDKALGIKDSMPSTDVNLEYFAQNIRNKMSDLDPSLPLGPLRHKSHANNDILLKLARTTPYYERNRPHICSFWVKGECKRGEECPFRHELPTDPSDPLSNQNIKDRFHGINDPVASKMLNRASELPKLITPDDKSISTLFIGGIDSTIREADLREYFTQFGAIQSIHIANTHQCAFVTFFTRESAELAIDKSFNQLVIKCKRLKVSWGRPYAEPTSLPVVPPIPAVNVNNVTQVPVPGLPAVLPAPPPVSYENLAKEYQLLSNQTQSSMASNSFNIQANAQSSSNVEIPTKIKKQIHYPSQDPYRMGSIVNEKEPKKTK